MQPLVSVVIPAYNEERYIGRCIDSLLKQTYSSMEIIFVDDGSKDKTRSILADAARKHASIRWYPRDHGGPGAARNFGASQAKGDILVFVDADMTFDKRYIDVLTKPVREGKTRGTFHTKELVANKENLWARSWCINRIPPGTSASGVYRAILKSSFFSVGGFDSSKGYFDDDLSVLGFSSPVPAVCYHNNPETLKEVFKHSLWIGRSLVRNPATHRKYTLALMTVLTVLLCALIFSAAMPLVLVVVLLLALVLLVVFGLFKALPRVFSEREPLYIISVPVLWGVRFFGYFIGALKFLMKRK